MIDRLHAACVGVVVPPVLPVVPPVLPVVPPVLPVVPPVLPVVPLVDPEPLPFVEAAVEGLVLDEPDPQAHRTNSRVEIRSTSTNFFIGFSNSSPTAPWLVREKMKYAGREL